MRGRKPKPTAIKIAEGNRGRRKLDKIEPQPDAGRFDPPSHLNDVARAEWARLEPELRRLNLLTKLDRANFAGYCQAYARWAFAEEQLELKPSLIVKAPSGYAMPNPYIAIANKSASEMRKFAALFGFSPSDRVRLAVSPEDSPNSEIAELHAIMGGRR